MTGTADPAPAAAPAAQVVRALVVTVSNRAADGVYEDTAGPVLVEGLRAAGLAVEGPQVVHDGEPVGRALRAAVAAGFDVVVTTGGTGLNPHDQTPQQTAPLIDTPVPGIAEALRATGLSKGVPTAVLSRGLAGMAGRTLVVNVAGSPGACRDAVGVLTAVLPHAVDQRRGGDHPRHAHRPDVPGS